MAYGKSKPMRGSMRGAMKGVNSARGNSPAGRAGSLAGNKSRIVQDFIRGGFKRARGLAPGQSLARPMRNPSQIRPQMGGVANNKPRNSSFDFRSPLKPKKF